MKRRSFLIGLLASACTALAQMPHLQVLHCSIDPYVPQPGTSNNVIVLYKSTSLGTVFTPFKPTLYFSASRSNATFTVLTGNLYHFRATTQGQPLPESDPSNTVTNQIAFTIRYKQK
jgi:hypothetical protein